jgi:hypothetical protein
VVVRILRNVLPAVVMWRANVDMAEGELPGESLVVLPAGLMGVANAGRRYGRSVSGGREAARFLLAKRARAESESPRASGASSGMEFLGTFC